MDEDIVEIGNVKNVCRLCLSTDKPRSSVFTTYEQENPALSLAVKIRSCLSIEVGTQLCPFVVCESRRLRFLRIGLITTVSNVLSSSESLTGVEVMFELKECEDFDGTWLSRVVGKTVFPLVVLAIFLSPRFSSSNYTCV